MAIKVVVEFQAKPGKRAELRSLLGSIAATHGPEAPGFLGSTVYEALDSAEGLAPRPRFRAGAMRGSAWSPALPAAPFSSIVVGGK